MYTAGYGNGALGMGAGGSCCQGAGDDERMVTKMDLSHCGCTEVPPIVFQAERYVETLNMSHNRILSLPPQLFHCQELKHLNIVDNGLDSLPPAIGSLLHLVSLKLDKNCLKDLPDNLKMCRKLRRLSLSNNQLQQLPGIVTQLISLEELYLNDCDFSFLPASVGRLTKLRILELRNNRLCNLPLSMSRITTLNRLDLGDNSFETLPECTASLGALQELLLDNNDLETISGAGLKKLEHLDVSYNNLRTIGKDIGHCTALTLLNLGWNYLETLPETVANLTLLEGLVIEMNELTSLPRALGKMLHLEELNVSNNRLCDLPSTLGLLRSLAVLNFSRNYVQELPCEIGSCIRLSIMNASYNRLQSLPAEVGYLNNLKVLDLVGNFLMYLPISMSNLTGVRAIWLSANQNVPLIPFTEDVSMASGERFLTNIALPQLGETALPPVENTEPVEKTSWRRKIRFEEDDDVLPRKLDRTPTPFPKELRCPTRKTPRAEDNYVNVVDGRVAVFQQAQQPPTGQPFSENNVTVIREANIRRNKDTKNEGNDSILQKAENHPEEPVYNQRRRDSSELHSSQLEETSIEDIQPSGNDNYDRRSSNGSAQQVEGYGRSQEFNESIQMDARLTAEPLNTEVGYYEPVFNGRKVQERSEEESPYSNRTDKQENGRMSPISEEEEHKKLEERRSAAAANGHATTEGNGGRQWTSDGGVVFCLEQNGRNEVLASRMISDGADGVDAASIDSFESERRRSVADSMEVRSTEMNRNQVIYSNLRNGNPYQQDPRSYHCSGYYTPPHHPPVYRADGSENYVPYRNVPGFIENVADDPQRRIMGNVTPNSIRPVMIPRQSPYGTVEQSPYGSVRQSPRPLENGNGPPDLERLGSNFLPVRQSPYGTVRQSPRLIENGNSPQEIDRPPSKQEMLSIAERNLSQNISPPCYEIAKMYSTKAALFEHCHRPEKN